MKTPKRFAAPGRPAHPLIEPLESRIAPAVTASLSGGVLTIILGAASDSASISTVTVDSTIQVSGTGLAATQFASVSSIQLNYDAGSQSVGATDSVAFALSGGFHVNTSSSSITGASFTDSTGGNAFDFSGFTGVGSFSNSGAADTITATKSANFTLTNTTLSASDGMSLGISGVGTANLKDTGSSHTFTVSGWTGGGALTGASSDTVTASKNASFTLTNTSLSSTDGMSLTLSGLGKANLTDTGGNHHFTVSAWTGAGKLTGTSTDAVVATKASAFDLSATSLSTPNDGMDMTLSGIGIANLTDAGSGGANGFSVDNWKGSGTLTNNEPSPEEIDAQANAGFTLTNTSLSDTAGMSLTLAGADGFSDAEITDTGGGHNFDVSGWTAGGNLTDSAASPTPGSFDTLTAVKSASFTLAEPFSPEISSSDGMTLDTTGFSPFYLTDTGGNHSFTDSGWNGTATLTGTATDSIVISGGDFTLTNTSLTSSQDQYLDLTLSGIGIADLTDPQGGYSFNVSGWTGKGTLSDPGSPADTVIANKSASFTLSNTALSSSDGMSMALSGIGTANLTDTGGGNNFTVSGWTGSGTLTGLSSDTVIASKSASFTLNNGSLSSSDGMSMTLSGVGIADLTDTGGSHTFTVSSWTGSGTLSGLSTDTVIAAKNGSFTLTNTSLTDTGDNMNLTLSGIGKVQLTDAGTGDSLTVSGWTGGGSFTDTGGSSDTVVAAKNASFTLTNTSVTSSDGMSMSLSGITLADLTDTGSGNSFTVSSWTHGGTLTGAATDTVIAAKNGSFTLSNTSLTDTADSMNITLSGIGKVQLTDAGAGHSFTVSGWTGGGSLTDSGGTSDTVVASKNASFTLTNSLLSSSDGMSLALSRIGEAQLTDTGAGHSFTVGGWTGGALLTDSGGTTDTVVASKNASFTLTNTSLTSTDGMSLTLSGISVADLTDTGSGHTFTITGWTGSGTLTGAATDKVVASKGGGFSLTNTSLADTADSMSMTLSGIGIAQLADTAGSNSFTVSGWTGGGSLADTGGTTDTVIASKSASFTLTNTSLSSSDGMSLALSGITIADLTDTGSGNSFTVSGWTGGGTLAGAAIDTVIASKNASFTLTNTLLSSTDGMSLALSGITIADLTDTGGGNSFTVSGWTGSGTSTGAATDTVVVSKNASFTLTNTLLSSSDGLSLELSGITIADLTDTGSGNSFTISGWTGAGALTGAATDTIIASKNASFTLTNTLLSSSDGLSVVLSGITIADLTDTGTGNIFTVSGWTGSGTLSGAATDTVIAGKDGDFTLTANSLGSSDGMNLTLSGIGIADLTDTGSSHQFSIDGWAGGGALTGAASDTVFVNEDGSFTLTNTSLTCTNGLSLTLSGITIADLTDTGAAHSFTVSGWTGTGMLTGAIGFTDTVIASKAGGFTLTNTSLTDTADAMHMTLVELGFAQLTDTAGGNSFTVSGWTGGGSLTNTGGTTDTVIATKSASFTLTNASLSSSDGMSLTLAGIQIAQLTDTAGDNSLTVSGWTGTGTLTGTASDTVIASKNASFTLTNTSLSSSDGMSLTLSSIGIADLTDTGSSHTFTVSGWTGMGTLTGAATDTVIASKSTGFTLTNTSLSSTDNMSLVLSGLGIAELTDTAGGNSFTVSGWTGNGSLTDSGGTTDTVVASKNASFTLTNTSLTSSDGMSLTLSGITVADLTDTGSSNTFTVSGWTGTGILTGTVSDTVAASKSASYTLTNTSLTSTDGMSLTLSGMTNADLTDTGGSHSFTVTGWTHFGTLTGTLTDTVVATKNGNFILTNTELADTTDGMTMGLSGIGIADLTDTGSANSFMVSGWTGTGTLDDTGGADGVYAAKNASFTLTDNSLSASDGMSLGLTGITDADLFGIGGGHSYTVTGWTHFGTLAGSVNDTVVASKNGSFTLTDTSLSDSGDGMSLALSGIGIADLTDTGGGNSFTVSGWTGAGSLTNTGGTTDTIIASKSASFTLTNVNLMTSDGMDLMLSGITIAELTDTGGGDSFTVTGWTGSGTLTGLATDTVIASKAGGFTLGDTSLADTADAMSLALSGIGIADLTDTAGGNSFTVSGWTGSGSLGNTGSPTDTIVAVKSASYILSNSSLSSTDGMSLTLSGITIASLTDTGGSNSFTVSGWTGAGTLTGPATDTVIASKSASYTLTNTSLTSTDGVSLTLSGPAIADLTDTGGDNSFTVTGWTHGGTLTGVVTDTVTASKAGGFTLTNTSLADSADAMSLTLAGIGIAQLTDTAGGDSFTVSGWTGSGSLTNSGGSTDTVIASKYAGYTLTNTSLSSTDNMSLTLSGVGIADLTDTGGVIIFTGWGGSVVSKAIIAEPLLGNGFTVTGWTGTGTLTGPFMDTVIASKAGGFTLTNTSLTDTGDTMSLTLSGIGKAQLTDTAGGNSFVVSGWTGGGSLTNTGGTTDTVVAVKSATGFTLTNSNLTTSDGLDMAISGIARATLTGTGAATFTFGTGTGSGANDWTGLAAILADGGAQGEGTVNVVKSVADQAENNYAYVLTDTGVTSNDGMSVTFNGAGATNNFMTANLTDNAAGGTFDINGWTYGFGAAGESASYATSGTLTGATGGGDTVLRQVASVSGEIKLTTDAIMSSNTASSLGDMAMQLVNFNNAASAAIVGEGTATVIGKPLAGWMINASGFGTGSIQMTGSASLRNLFVADAGADIINGGKQVNTYVLTTGPDVADTITSDTIYNLLDYENATSGVNVNLGDGAGQVQNLDGTDANSGTLALTGSYRYFIGSQGSDIIHASTNKRVTVDGKSINDETSEIYGGPGGAGVTDHIFKGVGSTQLYAPLEGTAVIGNSSTPIGKPGKVFEGLFDSDGLPITGTGIDASPTKVDSVFLSYLYNANTQIYDILEYQAYNSTGTEPAGKPVEPSTVTWLPFVDLVGAGDTTPV